MQPDSIVPDLSNPQSWNRYSYVTNRPVNFNDPTGHWVNVAIGAAIGLLAGAALYIYSESKQDGFSWKDDWIDLAVASGMGAVAGGLIGSGVGAPVGVEMLGGIGMATALSADHVSNIATGTNFSAEEHFEEGGLGFSTGVSVALLPAGTPALIQGTTAASIVGGYHFMKRRLHLEPGDDPYGDTIEMVGAGVGGGLNTGSSLVDGIASTTIDTAVNIYQKEKLISQEENQTQHILKLDTRQIPFCCVGRAYRGNAPTTWR